MIHKGDEVMHAANLEASRTNRGLTSHNAAVLDTVHRDCQTSQEQRSEVWKSSQCHEKKNRKDRVALLAASLSHVHLYGPVVEISVDGRLKECT